MKRILLLFLVIVAASTAFSQTKQAFPQLTWITAYTHNDYSEGNFGYDPATFTYVGKLLQNLPKSDPCYDAGNDLDYALIGRFKTSAMKESINILFSPGPSVDPQFRITDARNRELFHDFAEELCINANSTIYTSGNTNKMFNERRKYQYANGKVTEVKQPFCYVGVKGKLLKPVTLYSQKTGGAIVANLPVGYEIEVLLAEEDYKKDADGYGEAKNYLARSAFGLVGWLRLKEEDMTMHDPVVRGLGFMGD